MGRSLILCYHRVTDPPDDPFSLCVSPERFRAHLEELCRWTSPSTLDQLGQPSRRPRSVVTFDDGYADNLHEAFPIARRLGVPITVFVTPGKVTDRRGFWWDRLALLLAGRPRDARSALGVPLVSVLREDLERLHRALVHLPPSEIDEALDELADQWGIGHGGCAHAETLTVEELGRLDGDELATVGAHTTDHARLSNRTEQEQYRSIASSRSELEAILGHPVHHFAYPFGGPEDYNSVSVRIVEEVGFRTACTTVPGNVGPTFDAYELPRRMVMNWPRARFRLQMVRWRVAPDL